MSIDTVGVVGFLLVLGCWFAMYFRVRREHPNHPLSGYGSYVGFRKRTYQLVGFYREKYGFDSRLWGFYAGFALIGIVVLVEILTRG